MSSRWPTADQQPDATPAHVEYAHRWRAMPKVVTGDAVSAVTRLRAEDGGPTDVGGADLAAAVMRAGLVDEFVVVTHPVLVGGGKPYVTFLDRWVSLDPVEHREFPDGVLVTRYETRRGRQERLVLPLKQGPVATDPLV